MQTSILVSVFAVSFFTACGGVPPTSENPDGGVGEVKGNAVQCPSWDPYCDEDPDGGDPDPAAFSATFVNESGATRLFRIYTESGGVVLHETEMRAGQTMVAPTWNYSPGTTQYVHAEVWSHFGIRYGHTMIELKPTASATSCIFRYVEWNPGTGGAIYVYSTCSG